MTHLKRKLMMTLALLLTAATGAWAQETPLLTIESKGNTSFTSGSKTFGGMVTITFSNTVSNYGDNMGWYATSTASLTVAGTNGYTITSCKFYTEDGPASSGFTVEGESPSVCLYEAKVYLDDSKSVKIGAAGVTKIEVYGGVASSATPVPLTWDAATPNTATLTNGMPAGNVTVSVEYYPQATMADGAVTAATDVKATTEDALVTIDKNKLTGVAKLMYFVSTDAEATAPAYNAEGWTDQVPTAANYTEAGPVNVWYYAVGTDEGVGEATATYSDGDICAKALTVTLGAAPLWNAEFDLTDASEADKTGKWSTNIPEGGVKKGTEVTVTYTGSKKVIGVKAEKKSEAAVSLIVNPVVGQIIGSDGKNYDANATLPDGVKAVAVIAYVGSETGDDTYKNGLAIALDDEGSMNWSTAVSTCGAKTAITGAKWCLPSQDQWKQMFKANGGNEGSCNGLNTTITTAGGATLQNDALYWSSSESNPGDRAYGVYLDGGNASWVNNGLESSVNPVRACLAF